MRPIADIPHETLAPMLATYMSRRIAEFNLDQPPPWPRNVGRFWKWTSNADRTGIKEVGGFNRGGVYEKVRLQADILLSMFRREFGDYVTNPRRWYLPDTLRVQLEEDSTGRLVLAAKVAVGVRPRNKYLKRGKRRVPKVA